MANEPAESAAAVEKEGRGTRANHDGNELTDDASRSSTCPFAFPLLAETRQLVAPRRERQQVI